MSDHIDELCALVKSAGGTMRLYGKPVSADELRGAVIKRVDAKLRTPVTGMPTLSLSATIDHSRPGLGYVTVAGYTPPDRVIDDESPRAYGNRKPRAKIICTRCLKPGHNASNRKHHPRPL